MASLRTLLLEELKKRKSSGIRQNELYSILNYSRSHISETVGAMEEDGTVIRRKEGKSANRIWLFDYFPSQIEGVIRVGMLRSSEYVPFVSSLHKTLPEGYRLVIKGYDDASEILSLLHSGALEMALAPTFTHILYSMTTRREFILSTLSYGGSSLLINSASSNNVLATSESSTMALMSRELIRENGAVVKFFDDPSIAARKFLDAEFKYIAIWEPYLSFLRSMENIEEVRKGRSSVFLSPCCSVGVNSSFAESGIELIRRIRDDYENFIGNLDHEDLDFGLDIVSKATGFGKAEIMESLKSYRFKCEMSGELLSEYMINVGIPLSSERLREMILP